MPLHHAQMCMFGRLSFGLLGVNRLIKCGGDSSLKEQLNGEENLHLQGLCRTVRVNRRFAVVDSVKGNGFLQKLHCCAHETGDRTERVSCQNVDVCQRVQNN